MGISLLVDSNSYFRLARLVKPFLGRDFGEPAFSMHVIRELDEEFLKSPRLMNKFPWVNEKEHQENRQENCIGLDIPKFDLRTTISFMKHHKEQRGLGVSRVDIVVLATAWLLDVAIVSDDVDVQEMAKDFDMSDCMTSLDVLAWLTDAGHITLEEAKTCAQRWRQDKDLPISKERFVDEFFEIFGDSPW